MHEESRALTAELLAKIKAMDRLDRATVATIWQEQADAPGYPSAIATRLREMASLVLAGRFANTSNPASASPRVPVDTRRVVGRVVGNTSQYAPDSQPTNALEPRTTYERSRSAGRGIWQGPTGAARIDRETAERKEGAPGALLKTAVGYEARGRFDAASKAYRSLLKNYPDAPEAKQAKIGIEAIERISPSRN